MIFYNEFDKSMAQWLRNLMAAGKIPKGDVDERPIQEVRGSDLAGVRRAHFFAGTGGWEIALKYAGWPANNEVWTASLPCQPFSSTGRRKGFDDERHLSPIFLRLVAKRRPATIFGEQVASRAGRMWFFDLRSNLETLGYEVGAADLCSASIGALDIRQRLYWVANTKSESRPQANQTPLPSRKKRCPSFRHQFLCWKQMASPSWEIPASWVIRNIDGIPQRFVAARAYGNAINPWLAAKFIKAAMDALEL